MAQLRNLVFSLALLSVTCINSLSSSAVSAEIPVVKAPAGPFKVRLTSQPPYHGFVDAEYALDALAIPYIKNRTLRKMVTLFYWCGTPTIDYVMKRGMPSEQLLKDRAAEIEARWSDGTEEKISPREK